MKFWFLWSILSKLLQYWFLALIKTQSSLSTLQFHTLLGWDKKNWQKLSIDYVKIISCLIMTQILSCQIKLIFQFNSKRPYYKSMNFSKLRCLKLISRQNLKQKFILDSSNLSILYFEMYDFQLMKRQKFSIKSKSSLRDLITFPMKMYFDE